MKRLGGVRVKCCVGGGKGIFKAKDKSIPSVTHLCVSITCLQFGVTYSGKLTKSFAEFTCRLWNRKARDTLHTLGSKILHQGIFVIMQKKWNVRNTGYERTPLISCVLNSHPKRVTLPDVVLIQLSS